MYSIYQHVTPLLLFAYVTYIVSKNKSQLALYSIVLVLGKNAFIVSRPIIGRTVPIYPEDMAYILLLLFTLYLKSTLSSKYNTRTSLYSNPYITASVIILIYLIIQTANSYESNQHQLWHLIKIVKQYMLLPISVVLWTKYMLIIGPINTEKLIYNVTTITIPLAILYILSANGYSVYSYDAYREVSIEGNLIRRDFDTIPTFLNIALTYTAIMAIVERKKYYYALLTILLIAFGSTSTRSFVGAAVIAIAIITMYLKKCHCIRNNNIVTVAVYIIIITALYNYIIMYIPSMQQLGNRFVAGVEGGIMQDKNLLHRFDSMILSYNIVKSDYLTLMIGHGYMSSQLIEASKTFAFADSLWARIIGYFGILGVVIYGSMFIVPIKQYISNRIDPICRIQYTAGMAAVTIYAIGSLFGGGGFIDRGIIIGFIYGTMSSAYTVK